LGGFTVTQKLYVGIPISQNCAKNDGVVLFSQGASCFSSSGSPKLLPWTWYITSYNLLMGYFCRTFLRNHFSLGEGGLQLFDVNCRIRSESDWDIWVWRFFGWIRGWFFSSIFLIFLFIIIVTVADNFVNWSLFVSQESAGNSRGTYELDYDLNPKPNTNPKTGYIYTPTPQGWLIVVCVCVLLMFPFLIFVLYLCKTVWFSELYWLCFFLFWQTVICEQDASMLDLLS